MARTAYYLSGENVLAVEKSFHLPESNFRYEGTRKDFRRNIYLFDFEFRTVTVLSRGGPGGKEESQIIPFSQMDAAVVGAMREKLIELGGIAPEDPATIRKKGLTAQNTGARNPQPKGM